jgi:ferredoxin/flavodoxin---NADP+ reductase
MHGFTEGRVIRRHDWAPGLMTLCMEADIDPFAAGQFVNLGLDVDGQFARRAYSMASAPGRPLEFYLRQVDSGMFTPELFRSDVGSSVWVERKPQGFFTLAYVPKCAEMWLVATGTGLGPFMSMLRTDEPWQRFERIVVVHGVRVPDELSYAEELSQLSAAHGGILSRIPVVSRAPAADALAGRITDALTDGSLEARAGLRLDPARSHVMLCGNPDMLRDMSDRLGARGLVRHRTRKPGHVSAEKYW